MYFICRVQLFQSILFVMLYVCIWYRSAEYFHLFTKYSLCAMPPKEKPKSTINAVRGKVVVQNELGEKISQWGGTECYLTREATEGYLLVVKASRHRHGQGTFFKLAGLTQVLAMNVGRGSMTVCLPHLNVANCMVYITAGENDEVPVLQRMAAILQNKASWPTAIERNVNLLAAKGGSGGKRDREDDIDNHVSRIREVEGMLPDLDDHGAHGGGGGIFGGDDNDQVDVPANNGASPNRGGAPTGFSGLSVEQKLAARYVDEGSSVFVTGSAGTGKSEWMRFVLSKHSNREAMVVTAATGVAARMIGGTTVHSFAGIGLGQGSFEEVLARVRSRPEVVRSWQRCRVWLIDEIGMLGKDVFELLEKLARVLKKKPQEPFGGIQMILVGDFLQLPPVNRDGPTGNNFCFESSAWGMLSLKQIELRTNFRHATDDAFNRCMCDVRRGEVTAETLSMLESCVNRDLEVQQGIVPTHIMSLNVDVDRFNTQQLQALPHIEFQRYNAEDASTSTTLNLNNETSLPQVLTLKVDAQVVLLSRVPDTDLQNGDRGVVMEFKQQRSGPPLPLVRFESGDEVVVRPVKVDVVGRSQVVGSRTQVPLTLAWALTVHRVQGMTLPHAVISLDRSFFEYGQAYVALSRVRRAKDLKLLKCDATVIRAPQAAVNYYASVFPMFRRERDSRRAGGGALLTSPAKATMPRQIHHQQPKAAPALPAQTRAGPTMLSRPPVAAAGLFDEVEEDEPVHTTTATSITATAVAAPKPSIMLDDDE